MTTRIKNFFVYFVATMIIVLALSTLAPTQAQDQSPSTGNTARAAMEADLPEPEEEAPNGFVIEVETIVQHGDYAYGGWIFGETGGVVIAQKKDGQWEVVCSTGGVYQPNEMVEFCAVPASTAESLWDKWVADTEHPND